MPAPIRNDTGLSPRRRGNRCRARADPQRHGPIPAQAGEPMSCPRRSATTRAYPRAGGGTPKTCYRSASSTGLSPRRRGNRSGVHPLRIHDGPIPAQAGEPSRSRGARGDTKAYPRAGGGTLKPTALAPDDPGLSPRRRGNRLFERALPQNGGPIPAQAGEPSSPAASWAVNRAYPRAGGGTTTLKASHTSIEGLSPRRRGNHHEAPAPAGARGPIPAQAGEPGPDRGRGSTAWAYPRAGGGT